MENIFVMNIKEYNSNLQFIYKNAFRSFGKAKGALQNIDKELYNIDNLKMEIESETNYFNELGKELGIEFAYFKINLKGRYKGKEIDEHYFVEIKKIKILE